jgi:hypothetical protein
MTPESEEQIRRASRVCARCGKLAAHYDHDISDHVFVEAAERRPVAGLD